MAKIIEFFRFPMIFKFNRIIIAILLLIWPAQALCLTGQININTATQQQLQELPYIGESRAKEIIKYRQKHGPFRSLDDLLEVNTIGEKSLEAIRPYLTSNFSSSPNTPPEATASFHKKITTRPGDVILLPDSSYYATLVDFIRGADHSIDMAMFLFKTTSSPKNKPALLVKELIKARKRGVEIHVTLENSGYQESINKENQKVARKLRKNKIKVIFDSPNTTTHTKIVVIDNRYSFIGSHNLSHSALAYNHEFSVLIDNRDLADELVKYMKTIKK